MTLDAASSGSHSGPGNPDISWPVERSAEPGWRPARPASKPPPSLDPSNYPDGKKSLSGISLRAFLIGVILGVSACLAVILSGSTPLWRVPFFVSSLCLFHFLEYWVTARYNTRHASISAFLLTSNGWAYNIAHLSAMAECLIAHLLHPSSYFTWAEPVHGIKVQVVVGFILMAVGQVVRTLAMAQAGSNFNHTVQVEHKEGHMLVTSGVYSVLRHPSYFGFFWWGLGTQLVLGNVICFAGYTFVLWRFFYSRITREERFLIHFFGPEYINYKNQTRVGIPGIY